MADNPLTPAPLPPVQRLSRAVLVAAAGLVTVTLLAVAFFATPRPAGPAAPAARPPVPAEPGFLQRPPRTLPAPRPELSEQEYLRQLFERAAQPPSPPPGGRVPRPAAPASGSGFDETAAAAGLDDGRGFGAFGSAPADTPAGARDAAGRAPFGSAAAGLDPDRAPQPPRDARREAFLRALRAPLAQPLAPPRHAAPPGWPPLPSREALGLDTLDDPRVWSALPPSRDDSSASPSLRSEWGTSPPSRPGVEDIPAAGAAGLPGATAYSSRAAGLPGAMPAIGTAAAPAPHAAPHAPAPHARPSPGAILPAGTVIPALLLTAVSSDLPGPLMAQVSRDVYDFGQLAVVLPRGSRLYGRYDHQVAVGQRRLLVAWNRVQLPDGTLIELPGLPGSDAGGAAGLPAKVENHLLRVFGDAVLLSLLSAGAELAQPPPRSLLSAPSAGSVASAAVGQQLADAGLQLLRRDLSIQPTLRLPAGTPLTVFVNADLPLGTTPPPPAAPYPSPSRVGERP